MQVHEDGRVGRRVRDGHGGRRAHLAAEVRETLQPLCRVEDGARVGQRRLLAAQQRLVPEERAVGDADDRLIGHPQRLQSAIEGPPEHHAVSFAEPAVLLSQGLPFELGHLVEADGAQHHGVQLGHRERLDQVLECAVFHGLLSRLHVGIAGHEDDGNIEIAHPDGLQERDAAHPRHVDVAEDGIERQLFDRTRWAVTAARNSW